MAWSIVILKAHFYECSEKEQQELIDEVNRLHRGAFWVESREKGKTMKQKQMWMCVKCEMSGAVHFEEYAGVYEFVELLRRSHEKVSPNCDGLKLRVVVDTAPLGGLSPGEKVIYETNIHSRT